VDVKYDRLIRTTLGWCLVCRGINSEAGRCITTTGRNKELRFFEAGNLSPAHKAFIRHGIVLLIHCLKEAMKAVWG
jgi:hypothetical protein